jgi:hypothetical protein
MITKFVLNEKSWSILTIIERKLAGKNAFMKSVEFLNFSKKNEMIKLKTVSKLKFEMSKKLVILQVHLFLSLIYQ